MASRLPLLVRVAFCIALAALCGGTTEEGQGRTCSLHMFPNEALLFNAEYPHAATELGCRVTYSHPWDAVEARRIGMEAADRYVFNQCFRMQQVAKKRARELGPAFRADDRISILGMKTVSPWIGPHSMPNHFFPAWPTVFTKCGFARAIQSQENDGSAVPGLTSMHDIVPRMYLLSSAADFEAFESDFKRTARHAQECDPFDPAKAMPFFEEGAPMQGCAYSQELLSEFEHVTGIQRPQPRLDGASNIWILKPSQAALAQGISLMNSLEDENYQQTKRERGAWVVQKYVERPLLKDGRFKFDFRINVLVASADPLVLYVNNEEFIRVTTRRYNDQSAGLRDLFAHIANRSFQILRQNFENERPTQAVHEFVDMFPDALGRHTSELLGRVKRAMHCAIAQALWLFPAASQTGRAWELLGVDVTLDETFSPWVLEFNSIPNLHYKWTAERTDKVDVVKEMLQIVRDRRWEHVPEMRGIPVCDDLHKPANGEYGQVGVREWSLLYRGGARRNEEQIQEDRKAIDLLTKPSWTWAKMIRRLALENGCRSMMIDDSSRLRSANLHAELEYEDEDQEYQALEQALQERENAIMKQLSDSIEAAGSSTAQDQDSDGVFESLDAIV